MLQNDQAKMKLNYDAKFDLLHVALGCKKNAYGDDSEPGVIYLLDMGTDELKGITLVNFVKRYNENRLPQLKYDVPFSYDDLYNMIH